MFKSIMSLALTFLVMNLFATSCEGLRNREYNSEYETSYLDFTNPRLSLSSGGFSEQPTNRGLGLSAWEIVTVIVSIMLAIVGMYYISICYPILCEKSRNDDMINIV